LWFSTPSHHKRNQVSLEKQLIPGRGSKTYCARKQRPKSHLEGAAVGHERIITTIE
jgi:hypothetical protein